MNTKAQAGLVSFFVMAMIAVIIALQVTWPVIDQTINSESDTIVTGEVFNISGQSDAWIALANTDISSGSDTVGNATYSAVRNTDYSMNYTDGTIKPLSTGGLNFNVSNGSTEYEINYGHSAVTPLANMPASAQTLVDLIPLFLILILLMVFVRPLM
ncbi:hypothetical protein KA005_36855 [bacterium]|nr:hypothetical protein [bacterium]